MTYSFSLRAANKTAAKVAVAEKFAAAVQSQVCHKRDQTQVLTAANAFIDLLQDDDSKDVLVSVYGSLSGTWEGSDVVSITGAACSVSAGLAAKEPVIA